MLNMMLSSASQLKQPITFLEEALFVYKMIKCSKQCFCFCLENTLNIKNEIQIHDFCTDSY